MPDSPEYRVGDVGAHARVVQGQNISWVEGFTADQVQILIRDARAQLPELQGADLRAMRDFLPGKLLGRGAASLSLVLAFIGIASALDDRISSFFLRGLPISPVIYYGVLFGVPIVVGGVQFAVEWAAALRRVALKRLAVHVEDAQSSYFRIGPYEDGVEDRERFFRADRVHEKILGWIERATQLPLYLTGDSGSGKSSLLAGFVVPSLREAGWVVLDRVRVWQEPEAALRAELKRHLSERDRGQNLPDEVIELVKMAAGKPDEGNRLLLILDQFEEFVILGKPEHQKSFSKLLRQLVECEIKGLGVLLVMRSDYQALIDDTDLPPLRSGENFMQVPRFTMAAAATFLKRSDLELTPEAVDELLLSAAVLDDTPGLIRPITLNVIGYVLSTGRAVAPSLDAGKLVRQYIAQTVESPELRDVAPAVLEQMLTEQGTKRPRSEQEIMAITHLRRGEVRAVLNGLHAAAIARPLDAAAGVWELSHDFVARAIARHLGRRRVVLLRRMAAYAAPAILATAVIMVSSGIYFRPDVLRSGEDTVQDGYQKYEESGFSFRYGKVVGWNDLLGDILVANQDKDSKPAAFFLPGGVDPNNPGDVAKAGIIEMPDRSLSQVKSCPRDGYTKVGYFHPHLGGVYCVRVRDGDGYAKLAVREMSSESIRFQWVYNASGRPVF